MSICPRHVLLVKLCINKHNIRQCLAVFAMGPHAMTRTSYGLPYCSK